MKMGKPDGLSRRSGEDKLGMEGKFFEEAHLLHLGEDENINEGNGEDIEVEGIDFSQ